MQIREKPSLKTGKIEIEQTGRYVFKEYISEIYS